MNDDQLCYFLVDKATRNIMQVEFPSDTDEFNKILGTSEGKGDLLKNLGIILNLHTKTFKNPDLITKSKISQQNDLKIEEVASSTTPKSNKAKSTQKTKVTSLKKVKEVETITIDKTSINLFDGLFD